ncbi:MAG TPA: SRPBCC family protein [Micromonosporaceae bacterium]|jgi:uncharacterized protein YndB with AHSA1/START domain
MSTMTAQTTKVFQIFIRTTPDRVWEAITSPHHTAKYFFGSHVDSTFQPGAPIVYHTADRSRLDVDGEVLEVDPPRRLVTTWRSLWTPELAAEEPSRVSWEIETAGEGVCKLTLTHDRLDGAPKTAEQIEGWSYILSGMKTLLETGAPLDA